MGILDRMSIRSFEKSPSFMDQTESPTRMGTRTRDSIPKGFSHTLGDHGKSCFCGKLAFAKRIKDTGPVSRDSSVTRAIRSTRCDAREYVRLIHAVAATAS